MKIKSNVDLKELEKFGIKEAHDVKGHYGLCETWNENCCFYTILFEEPQREIQVIQWTKETANLLYDLFKMDFIEK